jgi:hypothetical protein
MKQTHDTNNMGKGYVKKKKKQHGKRLTTIIIPVCNQLYLYCLSYYLTQNRAR